MKYEWASDTSAIKELRVIDSGKKGVREAIILTDPSKPLDDTQKRLDSALVDQGFSVAYDLVDGLPALRVTGFKRTGKIIEALYGSNLVEGNYHKSAQEHAATKKSWRDSSLILSAIFYQLGNLVTILSGVFRKEANERNTGIAFAVGDTSMLLFGKRTEKEKYVSVMKGFGEMLQQNGYIPSFGSGFSASAMYEKPSSWQNIRNFMHDKVIAVKSLSEIAAGVSFARAGQIQGNRYKTMAGSLIASGFAISLMTPEKSPSQIRDELGVATPEEAKEVLRHKNFFIRLKYQIQQFPLFMSAFFAGGNNLSTLWGALEERRHNWGASLVKTKIGAKNDGIDGSAKRMAETISSKQGTSKPLRDRERHETAYSKVNRLRHEIDNGGVAEMVKLDELKKAEKELASLQAEDRLMAGEGVPKALLSNDGTPRFWMFNIAQSLLMMVANTLYGLSSKSGRSAKEEQLGERFVAAVATEVLLSDPEYHHEIINLAAHYAGSLNELDFTADEVRKMVEEKIELIQNHPLLADQLHDEVVIDTRHVDGITLHQGEKATYIDLQEEAPAAADNPVDEATITPVDEEIEHGEVEGGTPQSANFATRVGSKLAGDLQSNFQSRKPELGDEEEELRRYPKANHYNHHEQEDQYSTGIAL